MRVRYEECQAALATGDKTRLMEVDRVLPYRFDRHTYPDVENAFNRGSNLSRCN